jgi:fluoroquinolone resistance protein
MERNYIEDENFDRIDFTKKPFAVADYEGCSFMNCNFSNEDLSSIHFIDCVFSGCNISLVKLYKTLFRDVEFKDCKMLGMPLYDCNNVLLSAGFDNCILNHSSFFKLNLKKMRFNSSTLIEVDFTEADLTSAIIKNCDLLNAKFENTILEKADLRTSFNYSINPELNRIKKAKFSMPAVIGLLDKYDIEIE